MKSIIEPPSNKSATDDSTLDSAPLAGIIIITNEEIRAIEYMALIAVSNFFGEYFIINPSLKNNKTTIALWS